MRLRNCNDGKKLSETGNVYILKFEWLSLIILCTIYRQVARLEELEEQQQQS